MTIPITTEAALLQVLEDGPGYLPELIERVEERTGGELRLPEGFIYRALRELKEEGLIFGGRGPTYGQIGRPANHYAISPEGLEAAKEQRALVAAVFLKLPTMAKRKRA